MGSGDCAVQTVDRRTLSTVPTAPTAATAAVSILPRFPNSTPKGDTFQLNTAEVAILGRSPKNREQVNVHRAGQEPKVASMDRISLHFPEGTDDIV